MDCISVTFPARPVYPHRSRAHACSTRAGSPPWYIPPSTEPLALTAPDTASHAGTGAAKAIAHAIAAAGRAAGGTVAIQVSMYLGTALLANVVSNNAAAALMYPIAITIAEEEGLDKPRTAYLLMLAASASFAVPFAYQTNLMVYGAGGYTFQDFLRFGGPLQVRTRRIWYPAVPGPTQTQQITIFRGTLGDVHRKKSRYLAPTGYNVASNTWLRISAAACAVAAVEQRGGAVSPPVSGDRWRLAVHRSFWGPEYETLHPFQDVFVVGLSVFQM